MEEQFRPTGLTTEEVLREMGMEMSRSLARRGLVPDAPSEHDRFRNANTADEVLSLLGDGFSRQRAAQGWRALDTTDARPGSSTARDRLRAKIAAEEGWRDRAYDDATGRPVGPEGKRGNITVGFGFNLDQPGARDIYTQALGGDREAPSFDDLYNGRGRLTRAQGERLMDFFIDRHEAFIRRRVGPGVALREHQWLALHSMVYNAPALLSRQMGEAIRQGRWDEVAEQIRRRSDHQPVLSARRGREADLFLGPMVAEARRRNQVASMPAAPAAPPA